MDKRTILQRIKPSMFQHESRDQVHAASKWPTTDKPHVTLRSKQSASSFLWRLTWGKFLRSFCLFACIFHMGVILNLNRFTFQVLVRNENCLKVFCYIDPCSVQPALVKKFVWTHNLRKLARDTNRWNILNLEGLVKLRVISFIKVK